MQTATPLDQPRAVGDVQVSSKPGPNGPCIDGLRQSGALKVLFPKRKDVLEAMVINTAGGITGGDRFEIRATAGASSQLMLTTQAAERAYRAQPGQRGRMYTQLRAQPDATLFWLPQETILYDGAAFVRRLVADISTSSRFLMVEPILFGRRAMGEDVTDLFFRDHIEIKHEGRVIYRDGVALEGRVSSQLDRPAIGNGARAAASLVWYAPQASGKLNKIRAFLGAAGGATMLSENLLTLRLLAEDGFALRRHLLPILDLLTENALPQSWRL